MYFEIMDIDPDHFTLEGPNEDIFILSNGHISPAFILSWHVEVFR